jgi:hypothetical protein
MDQPIPSHSPAPDACRFRKDSNPPNDEAKESAVEIAERLLQIDLASHDLAWVRDQMTYFFATRSPEDTEFQPETKAPRYRWEHVSEGEEVGWLAN